MGIRNWKQRLFITNDEQELINKLKEKISNV